MVLPREQIGEGSPWDHLLPAPVKSVLRAGWQVREDGFVMADLSYDRGLGLITQPRDDEY